MELWKDVSLRNFSFERKFGSKDFFSIFATFRKKLSTSQFPRFDRPLRWSDPRCKNLQKARTKVGRPLQKPQDLDLVIAMFVFTLSKNGARTIKTRALEIFDEKTLWLFFKLGCILFDERIKLPCVEVARKRREREREREEEISRCAKKEESFLQQASLSIPSASTRNKKL